MSMERTLMSWNRTSLSLISFGFTISQFFEKFQEAVQGPNVAHPEAPRNLGLALILVGTLGTLVMIWQYLVAVRYLHRPEFQAIGAREGLPHMGLTLTVAVFSALIGIGTTVWIALHP
jgi:putative membrane protein